jgi:hypothetical protein
MISLALRDRAEEKSKDGRHVGLDFYDLLIEGTCCSALAPASATPASLQFGYRTGSGVGIHGDRGGYSLSLHRLAQKGFGRLYLALFAQIEIHCLASLVDRPL